VEYGWRVLRDPHATVFLLPDDARRLIEPLRRRWDPVMADQIAAHVTVTYPREIAVLDELLTRVAKAVAHVESFSLALGNVYVSDDGTAVLAEVIDGHGGFARLRAAVLGPAAPPGRPHVTLVHPRTSDRATEAWADLRGQSFDLDVEVHDVAVTAFNGERWVTVERFELRPAGPVADPDENGRAETNRELRREFVEAAEDRSRHDHGRSLTSQELKRRTWVTRQESTAPLQAATHFCAENP